jgi:xylulokinase
VNRPREARRPAILAVDLGSTSAKAGLVGLDGTLLGLARASYPLHEDPAANRAEQDPEDWWTAIVALSRELLPADADVVAIAVDGHGPTLTAVDGDSRPTRPAITWLDGRATSELRELSATTGLRGWALGVLPLALWVERHERQAAERTAWYLNTWEFLGLRLTGVARTTRLPGQSLPGEDVLSEAGVPARKVAPPIGAGERLGGLLPDVAATLGLAAGTPVLAGVVDAHASFHGAGLVAAGDAIDVGGAAGGFGAYWVEPLEITGTFSTPAPLAGLHVIGGAMAATGRSLDWLSERITHAPRERLLDEAAVVEPGAGGLIFLPYLAGERSPIWDPAARGAFLGLAVGQGRGHLARAVLEGAALAIRHVAEPMLEAGIRVKEMRVCGGPARSRLWNQIKADVTGFTVAVPHVLETAVVGSAILGSVGLGVHGDLPAAIAAMTRVDERLEPDPDHRAVYDERYAEYVAAWPAIAPVARRPAAPNRVAAPA